jgi:hypothetical protein
MLLKVPPACRLGRLFLESLADRFLQTRLVVDDVHRFEDSIMMALKDETTAALQSLD